MFGSHKIFEILPWQMSMEHLHSCTIYVSIVVLSTRWRQKKNKGVGCCLARSYIVNDRKRLLDSKMPAVQQLFFLTGFITLTK